MEELYVYLHNATSGGGHKKRAEEWLKENPGTIINKDYISSLEFTYDTAYIDVRECDITTAKKLSDICSELIFIDDYGIAALQYAKKIIVKIPYHNLPNDPRIERHDLSPDKVQRISCYLYTGYSDPHKLMFYFINKLRNEFPVNELRCVLGEGFPEDYIDKLKKLNITPVELNNLSDCQMAFCTWGLHYLEICQKIPTVPIYWDEHTQNLVYYFLGQEKSQ